MKELLGGKGANLAEMCTIGLPVPAGFTITTESCKYYNDHEKSWPKELKAQVREGIAFLEDQMKTGFGDPEKPLLVSVRSGAADSMPGMMDTVLNLGMNDEVVEGLARVTGNDRFAYDSYRRFIDMFGDVVMGVPHEHFEETMEELKQEMNVKNDNDLTAENLRELVDRYKAVYRKATGFMFPEDPREQLHFAINAVFNSWNSPRANKYRSINKIFGLIGTAVNIQAMVFGNTGDDSATGVCFTRNPSTGEHKLYGEFLINAQGEDVVAGIRTPHPIDDLKEIMPYSYQELDALTRKLEMHYKNMQDIEFTIQQGKLYILQTRNGKRTGHAAIKIAVDLVNEGIVSREDAVMKLVDPLHLDQLLHPQLKDEGYDDAEVLGRGLPASPGAAVGKVVLNSDEAEKLSAKGEKVILVRIETSPEDVGGHGRFSGNSDLPGRNDITRCGLWPAVGASPAWQVARISSSTTRNVPSPTDISPSRKANTSRWTGRWVSFCWVKNPWWNPVLMTDYHTFMEWVEEFQHMGRTGQCRHSRRCTQRPRTRRCGYRTMPYRAHVLRRQPHLGNPKNDPGRIG